MRRTTAEICGPEARGRLFGSRLDDAARGADIHPLVEYDEAIADLAHKRVQLVSRLKLRLCDQSIDVLVSAPGAPQGPVIEAALRRGVQP